jgi:hypothetical protein
MPDCKNDSQKDQEGSCGSRRSGRHHHRGRRKERVLHTRVSEQLSEDIKRLADDLRVPASNLVRNVLEEVFTAVENVSDDVGGFFEDMVNEAEGVRERVRRQQRGARSQRRDAREGRPGHRSSGPDVRDVEQELRQDEASEAGEMRSPAPESDRSTSEASSDILGWQPIVLNRAATCGVCETQITSGGNAFMAISSSGGLGQVVCPGCTGS